MYVVPFLGRFLVASFHILPVAVLLAAGLRVTFACLEKPPGGIEPCFYWEVPCGCGFHGSRVFLQLFPRCLPCYGLCAELSRETAGKLIFQFIDDESCFSETPLQDSFS